MWSFPRVVCDGIFIGWIYIALDTTHELMGTSNEKAKEQLYKRLVGACQEWNCISVAHEHFLFGPALQGWNLPHCLRRCVACHCDHRLFISRITNVSCFVPTHFLPCSHSLDQLHSHFFRHQQHDVENAVGRMGHLRRLGRCYACIHYLPLAPGR